MILTIDPPHAEGERSMALMMMIFKRLNVPIAMHKTVGLVTCLEYLGIILDSEKMEARLPQEKVDRIYLNAAYSELKRSESRTAFSFTTEQKEIKDTKKHADSNAAYSDFKRSESSTAFFFTTAQKETEDKKKHADLNAAFSESKRNESSTAFSFTKTQKETEDTKKHAGNCLDFIW
ncbi:Hypothetical predicted protein [Mytilus galloprovincialis]|uniref:Uncharacterized protein n=1 Tax=Mytilus galloprovincialis TaxID=29158 RepID=A0A8B6FBX9_MYTGA|nr:Hypothetical predicted protein [Mytilus galloprovincialis]